MYPELVGIAWVVAAVFALLVALPVLRDVAVDGIEHHRQMRTRGDDSVDPRSDVEASTEPSSTEESAVASSRPDRECRHCGAANDPTYRYCRRCGERL
ncbi:zinc ribbon domain-containing protein [Natronoarchaeum mannanilyticum]|uniref:DUF7577 domain-containing protein n=1 Tax=Natronoarchaeum mannanilyticum TaxID=926360 RepID=A0AAV3TBG6_9EURY